MFFITRIMTYEDDISKVNIDGDDFIEKSRSNYYKAKHFEELENFANNGILKSYMEKTVLEKVG